MYRKFILYGLLTLIFGYCAAAEKQNYVVPKEMKGVGYPAHTELSWKNQNGFIYEIYRSDGNDNFSKIKETGFRLGE